MQEQEEGEEEEGGRWIVLITVRRYKLECDRCCSIMLGSDDESPSELRQKAKDNGWTRPTVTVRDQVTTQDRCKECSEESDALKAMKQEAT